MNTSKNILKKSIKYIIAITSAIFCTEYYNHYNYQIIDGDTISFKEYKVRFQGIDAPESKQICKCSGKDVFCGQISTEKLRQFVENHKINCISESRDRYGRSIGECFIKKEGKNISLNQWMVYNGYAVAYKQFSKKFISDELDAKKNHRGFWSCEYFQNPADFRHNKKSNKKRSSKRRKTY